MIIDKAKNHHYLTIGIPRYIKVASKKFLTIVNEHFDFLQAVFFEKGLWKVTIKIHGESFYIEKIDMIGGSDGNKEEGSN